MKVTRDERAQLEAALRKVGAGAREATVLDSPLGGRIFLRGRTLWLDYSVRGERHKESAKTQDLGVAKGKLKERMAAAAARKFVGPAEDRLRWSDIQRMLETDYKVNGRRSARRLTPALRHLKAYFGMVPVVAITTDRIREYVVHRQEQGAAAASISMELAFVKRALNLAVQNGRLSSRPYVPPIAVKNTRQGFVEAGQLAKVLEHLPAALRAPVRFAHLTGWRKAEVLTLQWSQVDWSAGVVRLEPDTTKNDEGREFPFRALPQLQALLEEQRKAAREAQKKTGAIVSHVFHRNGKPIRDMVGAWRSACNAAGVPGLLFHDLRRTAVRNMERAGVSRSVAMKLSGHKTMSVYSRYAIADAAVLTEGVEKLARLHAGAAEARKVVPIGEGRAARAQKGRKGSRRSAV